MNTVTAPGAIEYPVAIRDKELPQQAALVVETYEMCTLCGERFGIGYLRSSAGASHHGFEAEEWPEKLKEILSKDHRHNRRHRIVIELDY